MAFSGAIFALIKISIWICLAHLYIIVCSIAYVELEGFSNKTEKLTIMDTFLTKTFVGDTKSLANPKSKQFQRFKDSFTAKLETYEYWKMRNEFNDISKVYVYVLGVHTTVGNSDMHIQTWKSKLLYILTVPLGILIYILMLHHLVVEFFEVLAYSAVSILSRDDEDWSDDAQDLYEKVKCLILALLFLIILFFLFGLLSLLTHDSYMTGLHCAMSLLLTVSYHDEYIPLKQWDHRIVASVLTFVYFLGMFAVYLFMYTVFILFRYNTLRDIINLISCKERFLDVVSEGGTDYSSIKKTRDSLAYHNAKMAAQDRHPISAYGLHPEYIPIGFHTVSKVQPKEYDTSDESLVLQEPVRPLRKKKRKKSGRDSSQSTEAVQRLIPAVDTEDSGDTLKPGTPVVTEDIGDKLKPDTPVVTEDIDDEFTYLITYLSEEESEKDDSSSKTFSDCTNISAKDYFGTQ